MDAAASRRACAPCHTALAVPSFKLVAPVPQQLHCFSLLFLFKTHLQPENFPYQPKPQATMSHNVQLIHTCLPWPTPPPHHILMPVVWRVATMPKMVQEMRGLSNMMRRTHEPCAPRRAQTGEQRRL